MKKFSLKPQVFMALLFAGIFDDADKAANDFSAGSGSTFVETESEKGKTLQFTDKDGNTQTAQIGDALKANMDTDGTTFLGWTLVPAATVAADWVEDTAE